MTKLGATGKFPHGKLSPGDEGQCTIAISRWENKTTRVDFGKPVHWFALYQDDVVEFCKKLMRAADIKSIEL